MAAYRTGIVILGLLLHLAPLAFSAVKDYGEVCDVSLGDICKNNMFCIPKDDGSPGTFCDCGPAQLQDMSNPSRCVSIGKAPDQCPGQRGVNEHITVCHNPTTGQACLKNAFGVKVCSCYPPRYNFWFHYKTQVCQVQRPEGAQCDPYIKGQCANKIMCDPVAKTCSVRCPFGKTPVMNPIRGSFSCRPTIHYNAPCETNFDSCSPDHGLACEETQPGSPPTKYGETNGFCRCPRVGGQVQSWSFANQTCLLAVDENCLEHVKCVTDYCPPTTKTCTRKQNHGRPCPSGEDQECESGYCDEEKICSYRTNNETTSGGVNFKLSQPLFFSSCSIPLLPLTCHLSTTIVYILN